VQPDCTTVGGISEAKRVADMASAWGIECVPHIGCSSGTGVGLAAALHLVLACENTRLLEFDAYGGLGWDGLLTTPIEVTDGVVNAVDAPGLGIELVPEVLERYSGQPSPVATGA
jgi:D-galactarolactone cycloisomerase